MSKKRTALLLLPLALLITTPAYAYLDGGTGSIMLQGLLAGIAGALAVLRLYWAKVKSFFSRKPSATQVQVGEHPSNDQSERPPSS